MEHHEGTDNLGRKGLAYDWQSLYVAEQLRDLDAELAELLSAAA